MRPLAAFAIPLLTALAAPAVAAGGTCPATDFPTFLTRFADDPALQRASVTDPLQSEYLDTEADPEPAPVSRQLSGSEVRFPVMPTNAEQVEQHLERQLEIKDKEAEVLLRGKDNGYLLTLYFRQEACWVLYRVKDESM